VGEVFDELFLDEDCELSVEAAMTLAGLALRLLDGDLSLTELDRLRGLGGADLRVHRRLRLVNLR